jgi:hypothetical protein
MDKTKHVLVSVPLLLRLFEYVREEPTSDEDLHFMAERMTELAWGDGVKLTMNEYDSIIPKKYPQTYSPSVTNNQTFEATE